MDLTTYDALITRLEDQSSIRPAAYRMKVRLLASLGYVVAASLVVGALLLLAAGAAALFFKPSAGAGKLAIFALIVAGPLLWSVSRALLYRDPRPDGVPVSRTAAPELWNEVDRLRAALGAPRIRRILIDNELNAALLTRRWGILPVTSQWLVLGLPLLRLLSVEEMRTVLAHELGHARGDHGRFGRWIYTVRRLWASLHSAIAEGAQGITARFLRWYAPYFNAYTFVLARQQEREADSAAVEAAGPEAAARALVRVTIAARSGQERFWQDLVRRAYREPAPPTDLLGIYHRALIEPHPQAGRWLAESLAASNGHHDTHPCLRERLHAITGSEARGVVPPPNPPSRSAVKAWLGDLESDVVEQLNGQWAGAITPMWREQHHRGGEMVPRRDALLVGADALSAQERWELVRLLDELNGPEAARAHLERLVTDDPTDAPARFALGRILLAMETDEATAAAHGKAGEAHLLAAMEMDRDAIVSAAGLLSAWHARNRRPTEAKHWEAIATTRATVEAKAREERSRLPKPKQLLPHAMNEVLLERLRQVLSDFPTIRVVDCAAVACQHLADEKPYHLFAVQIKVPFWKSQDTAAESLLLQQVVDRLDCPHAIMMISARGSNAKLAKAARKQTGARVYVRPR